MRIGQLLVLSTLLLSPLAQATSIRVAGLMNGKAIVSLNGGPVRMVAVGQSLPGGVKLLQADNLNAVFDDNGSKRILSMGQGFSSSDDGGQGKTVLTANGQGHFFTTGQINGGWTQMVVDTGATMVSMSAGEAQRLGIDYRKGRLGMSNTANGIVPAYKVTLDTVTVGDITLHQVDGLVVEGQGLGVTLLGMSFLRRLRMEREGNTLTLTKQY